MTNTTAVSTAAAAPTPESIYAALADVVADEEFARSPRIVEFLRFIVTETVGGRADYIKAYTIALAAFGRDEAFDPQSDPVVRVQAVRLRRMLTQYYLTNGKDDPVTIELSRGSYVPLFVPRGLKPEPKLALAPSTAFTGPSVVVLPFDNLSGDTDQDVLADGITEEIITRLAKFREMFVIARHTANRYKTSGLDVKQIAQELGVRYVMEGSVKRSRDLVRITARLITSETGSDIWNNSYDRALSVENLLELQDEIANKIVATIAQPYGVIVRSEMAAAERNKAKSFDVYEALLRFYTYYQKPSAESNAWAAEGLENAVRLDPNYAEAWGALACIQADQYLLSFVAKPDASAIAAEALTAARRANDLDPDSSIAQHGWIWSHYAVGDLEACYPVAERAVAANPNNTLLLGDWGFALACSGNWTLGLEFIDAAIALNPAHPHSYYVPIVLDYFRRDRFAEAFALVNRIDYKNLYWIHAFRAMSAAQLGEIEQSKRATRRVLELYPTFSEELTVECRKWSFEESVIDKIVDGWKKALQS